MGKVGRTSPIVASLVLAFIITLTLPATPAMAILVDGVTIEGTVTGTDDGPLEDVLVSLVGTEGYNTTTDADGGYTLIVPHLTPGYTLRFIHPDHQSKEVSTGPLEPSGWVTVNATLPPKPHHAFLVIRILPWDQPGSNYGLRQDVMIVVNATGTARFEWSEKSSEEEAVVPAPGPYVVTGTRPGFYPITVVVSVERGDRVVVDLDMTGRKRPTYGTVNGTVVHNGLPLANVTVVAVPDGGTRTYEAVSDDGGLFSLQLPNGTFMIRVMAEGYATLSEGVLVELGVTKDMHFPMSVAQVTGDEGSPLMGWVALWSAIGVLVIVAALAMVASRRAATAKAEEEARSEELSCPACGAPASADADRCSRCDAAFPWKSFRCPDCGAVLDLDATRCDECGNKTFDLHRG